MGICLLYRAVYMSIGSKYHKCYRNFMALNKLTVITHHNLHSNIRNLHSSAALRIKDPYSVLGIPRTASVMEIKKKFRELAKKYHPDLNSSPDAKQKMAEITSAYDILSDPQKKKFYDQTGVASDDVGGHGANSGFDTSGFDAASGFGFGDSSFMFSDFAEMFSRMASGDTSSSFSGATRGDDIQTEITLKFMEAIRGCSKCIRIPAKIACDDCNGLGRQPGTGVSTCKICNGTGVQRMERGPIIIGVPCRSCSGSGQIVTHPCRACGGTGERAQTKSVQVDVPPGVRQGMQMRIPNQGHVGRRGGKPGHLFLNINIEPHSHFRWIDDNIHVDVPITLKQCLLGGTISVPTLDGVVEMQILPSSQPNSVKTLKGRGPPKMDSNTNGNLLVHLQLQLPVNMSEKQKQLIIEFDNLCEESGTCDERAWKNSKKKSFFSF
ncbi:molecular chaperone DnaJ [Babesia microti strain RI]|uniref:Molecular chaperone DnaJ n=1 Tax=Babesia microti (strain RI) TaxID=1133968 RepID=A0A1N6LX28_BABMR|nr:molecular chaperone DnaJ [Babesia microti strain RI]SIO73422.1 molecular chaperone DnaJ [Babesia microti strain RI]|eukprot:XP_021337521.1 molecular chaperone DnaJ [Babesia microti strain RI]